ncbi:MAG: TldD/PmbA family protein [Nitrospinota bacterium]
MIDRELARRVVSEVLRGGGEFSELFIEESHITHILLEDNRLEQVLSGKVQGAGLRLIRNGRVSYAHGSSLAEGSIMALAAKVMEERAGEPSGPPRLKELEGAPPSPIERDPRGVSAGTKAETASEANEKARSLDGRIRQVRVIYRDGFRHILVVNSRGEVAEEERTGVTFVVEAVAREGDVVQRGYEPLGGVAGFELLEGGRATETAAKAAGRAIMMLEAPPAPAGEMTVVIGSDAGGTMIHEAVGHGLEADFNHQGLSIYSGKIGEKVASPLVTVVDDGSLPGKRGSSSFDDEGTPTRRTVLVEKGVLLNYMYDRLWAARGGGEPTGNGRRQSYRHRPIPRMTNTLLLPGEMDPQEVLAATPKGLYVVKMGGGEVNIVNGDFVFEVSEGYLIEGGKIGSPVRGATLIGNGPRVLSEIDMVGSDLGFGIGTCGKDGQGVPVSDAQPTIRIPRITVGGRKA